MLVNIYLQVLNYIESSLKTAFIFNIGKQESAKFESMEYDMTFPCKTRIEGQILEFITKYKNDDGEYVLFYHDDLIDYVVVEVSWDTLHFYQNSRKIVKKEKNFKENLS